MDVAIAQRTRPLVVATLAACALLVLGQGAAMAAPKADARTPGTSAGSIEFAGYTWDIKASESPFGPGPNIFSERNVRVDKKGRLHLKIRRQRGQWTAAEVILRQPLGYGNYSFDVATPVGALDPNVILGMFTYSHDPDQNHREIDIEVGQFGNPSLPNASFVVQPHTTAGNLHRWQLPNLAETRHSFDWQPDRVDFLSSTPFQTLNAWSYTDAAGVPDPGDAQARINLWLFGGNAPTDGNSVEVVISNFSHTPS